MTLPSHTQYHPERVVRIAATIAVVKVEHARIRAATTVAPAIEPRVRRVDEICVIDVPT